jgi:hypothetical protein
MTGYNLSNVMCQPPKGREVHILDDDYELHMIEAVTLSEVFNDDSTDGQSLFILNASLNDILRSMSFEQACDENSLIGDSLATFDY